MTKVIHNHEAIVWDKPGKQSFDVAFHQDGTWGNVLVPLTLINGLRGPGSRSPASAARTATSTRARSPCCGWRTNWTRPSWPAR
jgi:hypothetical protein